MPPDRAGLAETGSARGPLARLDARVAILATLGLVIAVVATPLGNWPAIGLEAAVLAAWAMLSRVSPWRLVRRWLGFLLLAGFLAAVVAPTHRDSARLGEWQVGLGILSKNGLASGAVMVLAEIAPLPRLLVGLRGLGAPSMLVGTLHFMARYVFVLGDELDRMVTARRARSYRRSGRLDWGVLTGLIGVLLLRAWERGERVHAAMAARGWDGAIRTLDGPEAPGR